MVRYIVNIISWELSPRNNTILACSILILSIIIYLIVRKKWARRLSLVLLFVSGLLFVLYGSVRFFPRELPTGQPIRVEIRSKGNDETIVVDNQKEIKELQKFFINVKVKPGYAWVPFRYVVAFIGESKQLTYRITKEGEILEDVPASTIQDIYVTREGLLKLISEIDARRVRGGRNGDVPN